MRRGRRPAHERVTLRRRAADMRRVRDSVTPHRRMGADRPQEPIRSVAVQPPTVQRDFVPGSIMQEMLQRAKPEPPKIHTVRPGDTLWDIADKHYAEPAEWTKIRDANVPLLEQNVQRLPQDSSWRQRQLGDLIHPGQEFTIPEPVDPATILEPPSPDVLKTTLAAMLSEIQRQQDPMQAPIKTPVSREAAISPPLESALRPPVSPVAREPVTRPPLSPETIEQPPVRESVRRAHDNKGTNWGTIIGRSLGLGVSDISMRSVFNTARMIHRGSAEIVDLLIPGYEAEKDPVVQWFDRRMQEYDRIREETYVKPLERENMTGAQTVLSNALQGLPLVLTAAVAAFAVAPAAFVAAPGALAAKPALAGAAKGVIGNFAKNYPNIARMLPFGTLAFGQSAREAEIEGASYLEQVYFGALSGGGEMAAEATPFGTLIRIINKLGVDELAKQGAKTALRRYGSMAMDYFRLMAQEATEEAMMDPWTMYAWRTAVDPEVPLAGEGGVFDPQRMAQAAYGGMALSVMLGALGLPATAASHIRVRRAIKEYEKTGQVVLEDLAELSGEIQSDARIFNNILGLKENSEITLTRVDHEGIEIDKLPLTFQGVVQDRGVVVMRDNEGNSVFLNFSDIADVYSNDIKLKPEFEGFSRADQPVPVMLANRYDVTTETGIREALSDTLGMFASYADAELAVRQMQGMESYTPGLYQHPENRMNVMLNERGMEIDPAMLNEALVLAGQNPELAPFAVPSTITATEELPEEAVPLPQAIPPEIATPDVVPPEVVTQQEPIITEPAIPPVEEIMEEVPRETAAVTPGDPARHNVPSDAPDVLLNRIAAINDNRHLDDMVVDWAETETRHFSRGELDELGYGYLPEGDYAITGIQTESVTDAGGRAVFSRLSTADTILEETTHHIQRRLEKINPDLNERIKEWENTVRRRANVQGIVIPQGFETFAKAYVWSEMGYADTAPEGMAELFMVPDDILDDFNKIIGSGKTGINNIDIWRGKKQPETPRTLRKMARDQDVMPKLAEGRTSTTMTDDGKTKIKVRYVVAEIDDVATSFNPMGKYPDDIQPRNIDREAAESRISEIRGVFEPMMMLDNVLFSKGAPKVIPTGAVIVGNHRVEALRQIHDRKGSKAKEYVDTLIEHAERLGISAESITRAKKPILLMELVEPEKHDLRKLAETGNIAGEAKMTATETAAVDSRNLTTSIMERFVPHDEGQIDTQDNANFISVFMDKIVPGSERPQYTKGGRLNQDGIARIRNAILYKAYGDEVTSLFVEDTDTNVRNIISAAINAAPKLVVLKTQADAGERFPLDITKDVSAAIMKYTALRARKMPVETYLYADQMQIVQDEFMEQLEARALLGLFDKHKRSSKRITQILLEYVNMADLAGSPKQKTMFAASVPTKIEVLDAVRQKIEREIDDAKRTEAQGQGSVFQIAQVGGQRIVEKKYPATEKEIAKVISTARGAQEIGAPAVVVDWVVENVPKDAAILDYGAGRNLVQFGRLKSLGYTNIEAHDLAAPNPEALSRQHDYTYASKVLNVQQSVDALHFTLQEIKNTLKIGGHAILNYPSPRYPGKEIAGKALSTGEVASIVHEVFKNAPVRVSGPKARPVWKVMRRYEAERGFDANGSVKNYKEVFGNLYVHESAVDRLPATARERVTVAKTHLPKDYKYQVIRVSNDSTSFIQSPDFNTAYEPRVGDSVRVYPDGDTKRTAGRVNNHQIYHHKWSMVQDDYDGFDVNASKTRSELWENRAIEQGYNIDRSRIGNVDFWRKTLEDIGVENNALFQIKKLDTYYYKSESIANALPARKPANQILQQMRKEVKADELKWTGLEYFLEEKGTSLVTKEQVIQQIESSKLIIHEQITSEAIYEDERRKLAELDAEINEWSQIVKEELGTLEATDFPHWVHEQPVLWGSVREGAEINTTMLASIVIQNRWEIYEDPKLVTGIGNEQTREKLLKLIDLEHKRRDLYEGMGKKPKFKHYATPGGHDYTEIYFRYPFHLGRAMTEREEYIYAKGSYLPPEGHELPANTLGHIRLQTYYNDDGEKVMFIEEIQSDWAADARTWITRLTYDENLKFFALGKYLSSPPLKNAILDAGYMDPSDIFVKQGNIEEIKWPNKNDADIYRTWAGLYRRFASAIQHDPYHQAIPDMPFKNTWHEMLLKRIVRLAADNNFDAVAWTSGEQQAERYNLSKYADTLVWYPDAKLIYGYQNGELVYRAELQSEKDLVRHVGKSVAERIAKAEPLPYWIDDNNRLYIDNVLIRAYYNNEDAEAAKKALGGDKGAAKILKVSDLNVGGQKLRTLYDYMIPQFLNKYARQWNAGLSEINLPLVRRNEGAEEYRVPVYTTETLREWYYNLNIGDRERFSRFIESAIYELDINRDDQNAFRNVVRNYRNVPGLIETLGGQTVTGYEYGQSRHPALRITPDMKTDYPLFQLKPAAVTGPDPELRTSDANYQLRKTKAPDYSAINIEDIFNALQKYFTVPIRLGRMSLRKAAGEYHFKEQQIRLRMDEARNLRTGTHETGHHLVKLLRLDGTEYEAELTSFDYVKMLKDKYGAKRNKGFYLHEGIAEFVYRYLMAPDAAKSMAPRFYEYFEAKAIAVPKMYDRLQDVRSMINAYQTTDPKAHIRSRQAEEPKKEMFDLNKIYDALVDELAPVERYVDYFTKDIKLDPEKDPYKRFRVARASVARAHHYIVHGVHKFSSDGRTVEKIGPSLKAILRPLEEAGVNHVDDWMDYLIAKRAIEIEGMGKKSGFDQAKCREYIKMVEEGGHSALYKRQAQELYKYQFRILSQLVGQSISKDMFDSIAKTHKHYIPFKRVRSDLLHTGATNERFKHANRGRGIKFLKGADLPIINPLESIVRQTHSLTTLAMQNEAMLVFVDTADEFEGTGLFFKKVPPPKEAVTLTEDQVAEILIDAGVDMDEGDAVPFEKTFFRPQRFGNVYKNLVTVWRDGKPKFYEFHDPDLMKAIMHMDSEQSLAMSKVGRFFADVMRLAHTVNLRFLIYNPARDQFTASIFSKKGYRFWYDFMKGWVSAAKQDDNFQEWVLAGGPMSTFDTFDADYVQKSLKHFTRKKWHEMTLDAINPLTYLRYLASMSEYSTNLGEYMRAKETGDHYIDATMAGRDITVDHLRHGSKTGIIRDFVPFFNAAIQSHDKLYREIRKHPGRSMLRMFLYITLPSIALYLINRDNPNHEELPPWRKDLFWNIPIGDRNSTTLFLPVPKPFLPGLLFGSMVERFLTFVDKKDRTAFDGALDNLYSVAMPNTTIWPIELIYEWTANINFFTGAPIVPQREQYLPSDMQYGPQTSEIAKIIGRFTDASPRMVQHTLQKTTGLLGRPIIALADEMLMITGIAEKETLAERMDYYRAGGIEDIPLIGDFFTRRRASGASTINTFYEHTLEAEKAYNKAKELIARGDVRPGLLSDREIRLIEALPVLRRVERQLSGARKLERDIEKAETWGQLGEEMPLHFDPTEKITEEQKRRAAEYLQKFQINITRLIYGLEPIP